MPLFGGEDTEACAFVVSEPHPYTSAESPYATPHKVSMPEECPMAENTFKILSAEGRSVRLLTARLKWCCTEQSKKARLISLVSKRREVISWQRACANGWLSSPRRMSPASTPHRKSSPLGVRPIPSPMSPARCWQHLRTNAVPDIRCIGGFGFWPRPELGCIPLCL